jgi:hypothetical protein
MFRTTRLAILDNFDDNEGGRAAVSPSTADNRPRGGVGGLHVVDDMDNDEFNTFKGVKWDSSTDSSDEPPSGR